MRSGTLALGDWVQVLSTLFAAVAAVVSAVSVHFTLRATRAVEEESRTASAEARYTLLHSFEEDYAKQYPDLVSAFGAWPDKVPVDPVQRRVLNNVLQSLSSLFVAERLGVVRPPMSSYLVNLFIEWIHLPAARTIWEEVFMLQPDTWPEGFVEYIQTRLEHRTAADAPAPAPAVVPEPGDPGDGGAGAS